MNAVERRIADDHGVARPPVVVRITGSKAVTRAATRPRKRTTNRKGNTMPGTQQKKDAVARAVAANKAEAKRTAPRKPRATKAATPKKAKATTTRKRKATTAKKSTRATVNNGPCSVKGCSFPARRRGMCSGKGSNNHYRTSLRKERAAA